MKAYFVVTDLGIEKTKDLRLKQEEVQKVKEAVNGILNQG